MAANGGPLKKRDRLLMSIQGRLYEAGAETHRVILDAALDPDKMTRVFDALNIESKDRFDEQLDALAYFIATAGEPIFLKRIKEKEREGLREQFSRTTPEVYKPPSAKSGGAPTPPPPPTTPPAPADGAEAPSSNVYKPKEALKTPAPPGPTPSSAPKSGAPAAAPVPPPVPAALKPSSSSSAKSGSGGSAKSGPATFVVGGGAAPSTAPAARPARTSSGAIVVPISAGPAAAAPTKPTTPPPPAAGAAPTPSSSPTPSPAAAATEPDPNRPWVKCATYEGPCRRVGPEDRRSHAERRNKLEAVMKNRRYAGARRKAPMGRRSGDMARNKQFYKSNALAGVVQVPVTKK